MGKCKKVVLITLAVGALLVVAFILIGLSLRKLNSDEIGVQYDVVQKVLHDEAREEGLHLGPVGFEFIVFPSIYTTIKFDKLFCLNKDGVLMELIVSFQYRVRKSALYRVVMEFKDHEGYETVLKVVAESAIDEACSQFRTFEFPSERGNFTAEIRKNIVARFKPLHCEVTDVQVNNFERPADYEEAVTQKERAREDIQVALNERPRQLTEARTALRQAEFQANITIAKAESEALIMQSQALAEAESIRIQYEKEAETYAQIMSASGLNFTTKGFLSYLGIRVISEAHNPVYVGIKNPAKVTYSAEP